MNQTTKTTKAASDRMRRKPMPKRNLPLVNDLSYWQKQRNSTLRIIDRAKIQNVTPPTMEVFTDTLAEIDSEIAKATARSSTNASSSP